MQSHTTSFGPEVKRKSLKLKEKNVPEYHHQSGGWHIRPMKGMPCNKGEQFVRWHPAMDLGVLYRVVAFFAPEATPSQHLEKLN